MRNFANRLFDILRHKSWLTDPAFSGSVSPYRHVPGYLKCLLQLVVLCALLQGVIQFLASFVGCIVLINHFL
jgi:hypothetical protein